MFGIKITSVFLDMFMSKTQMGMNTLMHLSHFLSPALSEHPAVFPVYTIQIKVTWATLCLPNFESNFVEGIIVISRIFLFTFGLTQDFLFHKATLP